jgi:hypothetical protein
MVETYNAVYFGSRKADETGAGLDFVQDWEQCAFAALMPG